MKIELYDIGSTVYCIEIVCQETGSEYCNTMMKQRISCDPDMPRSSIGSSE